MTESIQITELSMKDYEFVNRAYHVLHKEHVNGRPDIYVDTEELLTREEYQEILESDEYVGQGSFHVESWKGTEREGTRITMKIPYEV